MKYYDTVKRIIDEHDPYNLLKSGLPVGMPKDEFAPEARMIAEKISESSSPEDIRNIVSEVFLYKFDDLPKDCEAIGTDIYQAIQQK